MFIAAWCGVVVVSGMGVSVVGDMAGRMLLRQTRRHKNTTTQKHKNTTCDRTDSTVHQRGQWYTLSTTIYLDADSTPGGSAHQHGAAQPAGIPRSVQADQRG